MAFFSARIKGNDSSVAFFCFLCSVCLAVLIGVAVAASIGRNKNAMCKVDTVGFTSEEEFLNYLRSPEKGDDIAELEGLEKYYILENPPEGFSLYKITAGCVDIGFWYVPNEYMTSRDKMMEAEAHGKYYQFIYSRGSYSLSEVLIQDGLTEDNLVGNYGKPVEEWSGTKYYFTDFISPMYVWEHNGEVMELYTPQGVEYNLQRNVYELCALKEVIVSKE